MTHWLAWRATGCIPDSGLWLENLSERYHLEDPGVDGRVKLNGSSRSGMWAWTGLIWLRIESGGWLLLMW